MSVSMWITVYCDASHKDGISTGGYWIKSAKGRIIDSIVLKARDSVMAEFEIAEKAIYKAIEYHYDMQVEGILLVSDNMQVVKSLRFNAIRQKNPQVASTQLRVIEELEMRNIRIRTKHQKGHTSGKTIGGYVNNAVDQLARQKREYGR